MLPALPRRRRKTCILALAALLLAAIAPPAWSQARPSVVRSAALEAQVRALKQLEIALAQEASRRHFDAVWQPSHRMKPARLDAEAGLAGPPAGAAQAPVLAQGISASPPNVRVNNPTGDAANAGQAEEALAFWGRYGVCAWNDGQGLISGSHTQGVGYSIDGGASWTDAGSPPTAGATGGTILTWTSDPSVAVNARTGEFYVCALFNGPLDTNGIAIVPASFPGGVFAWGVPHVVGVVASGFEMHDKEWLVADSTTGNLYLTYTHYVQGGSEIAFRRSSDGGASWDPALGLSNPYSSGLVQGSRPATGPGGEVYVVWKEIGLVDVDYMLIRKSTDRGASFGPEVVAADFYDNYGTGAPGFNRERAITYPSIAVDATSGPNRGRVHVTWAETIDWADDLLGTTGPKSEVENNNFFNRATPFTAGKVLRGAFNATTDIDLFSWPATQGSTYFFFCDSVPRPFYTLRVFCGTDTLTRLAYSGRISPSSPNESFIVFTAPATGTYYLRMFYLDGGAGIGGYRIQTGVDAPSPDDRARDRRDVYVTRSDGGDTWSFPVRVNDDAPLYDNWLPEVAVGADGCPYVTWYDWRDATGNCGGSSHLYVSRSTDGGATWAANQRVTSSATAWTTTLSNIAPNQGDYLHTFADTHALHVAWADGRLGNADVFATTVENDFQLSNCPPSQTFVPGQTIPIDVGVANLNPLFANTYHYALSIQRGWPLPAPGTLTVAAASSGTIVTSVSVPDTAAPGNNLVELTVNDAQGAIRHPCSFWLLTWDPLAVDDTPRPFTLRPSMPNPAPGWARFEYALPRVAQVRLRIYGLRGERVRSLVDGLRPAGLQNVLWDGRDDLGAPVPSGAYFVRLEAGGLARSGRLVLIR